MPSALGVMPNDHTETPSNNVLQASLVCFTASLFFFYEFVQLNMFNAIDPALMREFQISAARLGQLSAHYFYANVLFLFPAGIILDRVSTRKVILLAMALSIVSTILFAFASSIAIAEICRFLTGIAASFCFLSCMRLASRWFPPKHMALVMGLIVTMAMLGGMVAQTPMTLLTDAFGWRNTLLIDAAAGAVMLLAIFLVVRDYPSYTAALLQQQRQDLIAMGFWKTLARAVSNLQNWLAGLYTCLLNLPIFLLGAMWGSLYLVQIHDLTRTQSSYVTSMIFVGTIIGSPAIGLLSDRITRRKMPMIVCAICSLIVILLIMYLPHLSVASAMWLFFALGFFTSAQIISYPLIAESNPRALIGTASGLASTLIMAGGVSQPIFGWLMGLYWNQQMQNGIPLYSINNFRIALAIMPIAFILGLVATVFIKETYCKSQS